MGHAFHSAAVRLEAAVLGCSGRCEGSKVSVSGLGYILCARRRAKRRIYLGSVPPTGAAANHSAARLWHIFAAAP